MTPLAKKVWLTIGFGCFLIIGFPVFFYHATAYNAGWFFGGLILIIPLGLLICAVFGPIRSVLHMIWGPPTHGITFWVILKLAIVILAIYLIAAFYTGNSRKDHRLPGAPPEGQEAKMYEPPRTAEQEVTDRAVRNSIDQWQQEKKEAEERIDKKLAEENRQREIEMKAERSKRQPFPRTEKWENGRRVE